MNMCEYSLACARITRNKVGYCYVYHRNINGAINDSIMVSHNYILIQML